MGFIAVSIAVNRAGERVIRNVTEVNAFLHALGRIQGDGLGGIVLRTVRVLGLLGVRKGTILDDLHRVGAIGQVLEGVAAIRAGLSRRNDVAVFIQQLDGLAFVALFAGVQGRGTVIVAVDRTLDDVVRVVSEVHTGLGRVVRTD